jgi:hypothetical protein
MISGKFENVKSWNPGWPTLYNMKITLKNGDKILHEVTERIGFRTVELRIHDGFYVNGEKVVFKGVNRHSFWPETGRCLSEENHLTDINLMKEMNMNAVRMSHYVPDKRFLELCDSLGLFVLDEVTGWQQGYDTIVGPKLVKETVLRDHNHPSVVVCMMAVTVPGLKNTGAVTNRRRCMPVVFYGCWPMKRFYVPTSRAKFSMATVTTLPTEFWARTAKKRAVFIR